MWFRPIMAFPRMYSKKYLQCMYSIKYNQIMAEEVLRKKINAVFFRTLTGNEPVKDAIKKLGRPVKTIVGEDMRFVELNWRVDKPYVDRLRSGSGELQKSIYEVRHTVERMEFRTLFFVYEALMVLVHFFHKTTRKTPKTEIDLAWNRMKEWMAEQKKKETVERKARKKL